MVSGGVGNDPHYADHVFAPAQTDPLASARARARQVALEEYRDPSNLTLLDARDYTGRNERSINEERQRAAPYTHCCLLERIVDSVIPSGGSLMPIRLALRSRSSHL